MFLHDRERRSLPTHLERPMVWRDVRGIAQECSVLFLQRIGPVFWAIALYDSARGFRHWTIACNIAGRPTQRGRNGVRMLSSASLDLQSLARPPGLQGTADVTNCACPLASYAGYGCISTVNRTRTTELLVVAAITGKSFHLGDALLSERHT